jgi:signal transduction histidine kinase
MSAAENGKVYKIRARTHILQLMGEELIGDDGLAVFELVKNGYDADATEVDVDLNVRSGPSQSIVVLDSGTGMTLEDITGKWLELATDSKRTAVVRTKKFRRRVLGEKGIGRIASFKLGRRVSLITRAAGEPEYEAHIDWDELLGQGAYLEDLGVRVRPNAEPKYFPGRKTGTRIEISGLRRQQWTRGDLRKLYRLVSSLASPFQTPDQFKVEVAVPGREAEVKDLIAPDDFLDYAVWKFHFRISEEAFDWEYTFNPPRWKDVHARSQKKKGDRLLLTPALDQEGSKRRRDGGDTILMTKDELKDIGPVEGFIYAYYRRAEVLNATGNSSQVKTWLDDQVGVRVYRDGVRVFTYGEKNDDWLGLNVRRINTPAGKLGTNSLVAAIHLDLDASRGLREKTNREGFDQNDAFERLRRVALSVFEHLERLHAEDRKSLDDVIKGTTNEKPVRFVDAIDHLKDGLKSHELDRKFAKDVEAIEQEFVQLRDVMTNAGMAGLNLAVIFHEVERGVDALANAVERGIEQAKIREQIENLHQLLKGFAPLLKKNPSRLSFASDLVKAAYRARESRFIFHKVSLSAPLLQREETDFRVRGVANLLVGALGNVLDNAQFWARYRKERDERATRAAVLVTSQWDKKTNSGLIAVVDNGPGFDISPTRAVEAFFTTRPGGMGLGLYFANMVMEQCGGELTIHAASDFRDEVEFPKIFDGAAVVLRFGEGA